MLLSLDRQTKLLPNTLVFMTAEQGTDAEDPSKRQQLKTKDLVIFKIGR